MKQRTYSGSSRTGVESGESGMIGDSARVADGDLASGFSVPPVEGDFGPGMRAFLFLFVFQVWLSESIYFVSALTLFFFYGHR